MGEIYWKLKVGTIIFRLWNEASLINCTAITEVTPL